MTQYQKVHEHSNFFTEFVEDEVFNCNQFPFNHLLIFQITYSIAPNLKKKKKVINPRAGPGVETRIWSSE